MLRSIDATLLVTSTLISAKTIKPKLATRGHAFPLPGLMPTKSQRNGSL
jgi:hypothetical protein